MRHGFACRVLEETGNVKVVKNLLGHQSLNIYLHHSSRAQLAAAVATIG